MAGNLITLPLRVPLRSAQLLTRVAGRALSIAGHATGVVTSGRSRRDAPDSAPRPAPATEPRKWRRQPVRPATPAADVEQPPAVQVRDEPAAEVSGPRALPFEAPVHVSEEVELVRESAEPGAENGAGAAVTVKEPWAGYRSLNARDVIDRTRTANVAELAAVRLYESRHRSRRTVLAAVDRQLKLADGGLPA
jgi:hypothetical protein